MSLCELAWSSTTEALAEPSSLKQQFIEDRIEVTHNIAVDIQRAQTLSTGHTGTRWEQTEGWTVKDQRVLWVEGGEDIAKEEWVGRERRRRREEELGNK